MREKDLNEAASVGVLAEFCDACGNLIAQEVFFDWRDAPFPAIGDLFTCTSPQGSQIRPTVIAGRVRSRYFDVQRGDEGESHVWVRLTVDVCSVRRGSKSAKPQAWASTFSLN